MVGIDEVGRGAWAGPLVVAGVRFSSDITNLASLADSKVLTTAKRQEAADIIRSHSDFHIVFIAASDVDRIGLTEAIRRAVLEIVTVLDEKESVQLDGPYNFLKNTVYEPITRSTIRADSIYPEVMAASIIAKVARDEYMKKLHLMHPVYHFATNVGYGTKKHIEALAKFGICAEHRRSFKPISQILAIEGTQQ